MSILDEYEYALEKRDDLILISISRDWTKAEILQYQYWDKLCEHLEKQIRIS